ncbi:Hpt domain-containing protein [uncultured Friedmanniella sp.]|uniref:Hpt domain-containing protein n=1 Tax=uncultured Friedmanniella sp. TaxID=335381 RepID=UPI0035CBB2A8
MSVPSPEERVDAVAAVLRGLAKSAAQANLARSSVIDEAVRAAEGGELLEPQRVAALAAAHQVVGSAGTFGWPRASRTAADLEHFFAEVTPTRPGLDPDDVRRARQALEELTALLSEGADEQDGSYEDADE